MYPVVLKVGHFAIKSYGLFLIIAFLLALYMLQRDARRYSLDKKTIDSLGNYLLLGGLIGARLYYAMFFDPWYYFTKPWTLLFVWEGGLAVHGAIIGGFISLYIFSKKKKYNIFMLADLIVPVLLLGQAIGRLGCFFNGCCYGVPSSKAWALTFPKDSLSYFQFGFATVHPTQLYEFILCLFGFFIFWLIRKNIPFRGFLFSLYLIYYGLVRFVISFFRADSLYLWNSSIKVSYLISIFLFLWGIFLFVRLKSKAHFFKLG